MGIFDPREVQIEKMQSLAQAFDDMRGAGANDATKPHTAQAESGTVHAKVAPASKAAPTVVVDSVGKSDTRTDDASTTKGGVGKGTDSAATSAGKGMAPPRQGSWNKGSNWYGQG